MTRAELQNALCDTFPLDKYETFVDCMLARLEAITDALTDDELVINVARDFAPGEHFCSSDAQHCVSRGSAIIGFKNAIIDELRKP